jgi:drug/metabolite transporter (DMT)-like permease
MTENQTRWIGRTINCVFFAHVAATIFLGERMNQNQLLGCLVVWGLLASWAAGAFWHGARPFFKLQQEVPWLRVPCRVAPVALTFAVLQIPIWSLMTRQFPPDHFSNTQAYVFTAGVLFGLGGPMAPMLTGIGRRLREINKDQRRKIKEKKERSQQRPEPYR